MAKIKKQKPKPVAAPKPAEDVVILPPKRMSDDPLPKQVKWINRQRVLVFASRGINHRHRHLMEDIKRLMPHHKSESKMERSKNLYVVNEISEMKNCNKCLLFEGRKMRDLYLWMSNIPNGPSVKLLVENVYTMAELKMTGNCLKGSRPLLSFDPQFTKDPHYSLLKEILIQIFGVPNYHPKSQPFFDHVYTFMVLDNRIWFRNYQILSEDGALAEIGPRFVLNPVKIFSGSFGGTTIWENPKYVSPAKLRQAFSKKAANKYERRVEKKAVYEATKPETGYPDMEELDIFKGNVQERAKQEVERQIKEEVESDGQSEDEDEESMEENDDDEDNDDSMKDNDVSMEETLQTGYDVDSENGNDAEDSEDDDEDLENGDDDEDRAEGSESDSEEESSPPPKPLPQIKKKVGNPEKTIRRKQLKAKSKIISAQIKKKKQKFFKKGKK